MDTHISYKLLSIEEQLEVLNCKFEKSLYKSYPNEQVKNIIEELYNVSSNLFKILQECKKEEADIETINDLAQAGKVLYDCVGRVERSNFKNHPIEIMIPVKEVLSYIGKDHIFITEPIWDLNYAIGPLFTKSYVQLFNKLGINVFEINKAIQLLFPGLHQNNVILGSVMSHELGHYIDLFCSQGISEELIVYIMNSIDLKQYIQFYITSNPMPHLIIPTIKACIPSIVLRNWIREIVADIIGVIMYGAASYFATEHVSIYYNNLFSDSYSRSFSLTHPRDKIRNLVRFRTMEKLEYFNCMNETYIELIKSYRENWEKSQSTPFRERELKIGQREYFTCSSVFLFRVEIDIKNDLDNIIDFVINKIRELSPNLIYNPENYKILIPKLINKIMNIIPPNEIDFKPVDSISILNAGWIAYLGRENLSTNPELDIDSKELINGLIRKALLSADVHRRWNNVNPE